MRIRIAVRYVRVLSLLTKKLKGRHMPPLSDLKYVDNNDTVSNSFIWFHSKNETINREVKLSFGTETMLISLSN